MLRPSVRPLSVSFRTSVNTYFVSRDISVHSGGISMKLATTTHHVNGNC